MNTKTEMAKRGTKVDGNELAQSAEVARELAPSAAEAMATSEIQSAIIIAKRFPRNEDEAYGKLMKAVARPSFAEDAYYEYDRGGSKVRGASVNLAREAARVMGNIRYGCDIVSDDEEIRHIRGWAWDIETNAKETQDDTFKKLIQRKGKGWIVPDERDLRELTNRRGAICVRNCILHLMPKDFIDDAVEKARQTVAKGAVENLDENRKKIINAFASLGVTVEDLEAHLGHKLAKCSPAEVADLRGVYKSIADGNSTWAEYAAPKAPAKTGPVTADDLTGAASQPAADDDTLLADIVAQMHAAQTVEDVRFVVNTYCGEGAPLGLATQTAIRKLGVTRELEIAQLASNVGKKQGKLMDTQEGTGQ